MVFFRGHRRKVYALAGPVPQVCMVRYRRNVGYSYYFFPQGGVWVRCGRYPPSLNSGSPFYFKFTLQNIYNSDELVCRVFDVSASGLPAGQRTDRLLNMVHHGGLLVGLAPHLNVSGFFWVFFFWLKNVLKPQKPYFEEYT